MTVLYADLGLCPYREVHRLQCKLVQRRYEETLKQDVLLVCEHPSVYTFGKHADRSNLHVSDDFLSARNISLEHVERGGEITYHGPGQLVLYPVVKLRDRKLRVVEYIYLLEEIMLKLVASFGLTASRNSRNAGVWRQDGTAKIGSVGIAVRHGVAFHGLALNINLDLEPFLWITPCGLSNVTVTSLAAELASDITMAAAKLELVKIVEEIFGEILTVEPSSWKDKA